MICQNVILATGHSARDIFELLHSKNILLEAKPFALGVRIEHPQSMIDKARLRGFAGHPDLGAADYKLVHHAKNGRAVYSFCMYPGGTGVAATSEPGCHVHFTVPSVWTAATKLRGHTGVAALLGSTAESLAQRCPMPLLVQRDPAGPKHAAPERA